ncbi:bifunctional ADP-dependent NAD(P)H-hydrate dehydratase/NAD(P)H-hydrate epimerase [Corynebacterium tapiri]|uniref:ADP-dependent (S)-NAD(P)H-hydrate dehydratase n=1 Tax=Corynebacterium tapiri TaxID=1448266 RepID=A0A5C4U3I6_9CORY|nr:bifunctional ADP-dependent NAD(P)H-hydrate dehydratase/NAD(P)H-hydrate epimerase [Corynebacterium tapiri]TNL95350.1 bifunctional ADP-dependent NAD(P)H-hydrate dehydratase/NAD(P)H-hydrate epimerase [Corynebacterium tapiri]
MALNALAYSSAQIRAAEAPLLAAQTEADELMRSAALGISLVARDMLPHTGSVLILAGPGGNGGDGLYAGAELARQGYRVDALLYADRAQERAVAAFTDAGGQVVDKPAKNYTLIIDAIFGLGGRTDIEALDLPSAAAVLAVDVPSGVAADTGRAGENALVADVTATIGGLRYAHGLYAGCGDVVVIDAHSGGHSLSAQLAEDTSEPRVSIAHARRRTEYSFGDHAYVVGTQPPLVSEPTPQADKYSGGVVGIAAGSTTYPGAAVLCATGAVRATSSMVRYAGPQAREVVRALPEVVATESIDAAGRVQAWVYGPGSGTTEPADLRALLRTDLPVVIDADGLTLLSEHTSLRELVRSRRAATILTPHAGEFARLASACGLPSAKDNPLDAVSQLARELDCAVLLKGRASVIATPRSTVVVDAGSSWAATPGSGDVLSGILGAFIALRVAHAELANVPASWTYDAIPESVCVHAVAAYLSACTPWGEAPTSASRIAESVPAAIAYLSRRD